MNIKLLRLELENFMFYKAAAFDFSDVTKVLGKNGKGKSSIANAYMWLLFNCDCELRDNPVVRHEEVGVLSDGDVSVTAVIDIDGKEITAKKIQRRTYSKDGSYKDDNKYFINDLPKTLKDFNAYFEIDMNAWKMYSSINAFLNQKPTDMRRYLFFLVDGVSDLDIARSEDTLKLLIPMLEKYTFEELLAMNKVTKKRATEELSIIDGRIKEKERDIQIKSDINVSDLELLKNTLGEQLRDNLSKQTDYEKMAEEVESVQSEIMKLKFELSGLQNEANEELVSKSAELHKSISDVSNMMNTTGSYISECKRNIVTLKDNVAVLNNKRDSLAKQWQEANSEVFDEDTTICPTCKRKLATNKVTILRNEFEGNKKIRLDDITTKGMECKAKIDSNNDRIKELQSELDKLQAKYDDTEERLAELRKQEENQPAFVDISDREDYKTIQNKIKDKEDYIKSLSANDLRAELKLQENEIRHQLTDCENKISASDTQADEERLAELNARKMDLEQSKIDCEKVLDLLSELDNTKNDLLTDKINRLFGLVTWKLFEYAKNGNYKSTCIPMVDGKSILTTISNKGNRILGRVDICNSIQKISGIHCPIFLDDCESLDEDNQKKVVDMVDSQLVMMVVSEDDELKVEV